MPKVLLHNLTIQYRHYDPHLFDFDQNAVFFAEKRDVVVTRAKISEEYLSFLERIGFDISSLTFIFSDKQLEGPTAVFEDRDIIDNVRQLVKQNKGEWKLDSYMLTDKEVNWAREAGLSFDGNPSHYHSLENKSAFRTLARKHGLPIPVGFENLQGFFEGGLAVVSLFAKGFPEIVIKQDEGAAGLGSLRLTFSQFLSRLFCSSQLFPGKSGWGLMPLRSSAFVVEAWYQNVVLSPSLQFYIHNNADCQLISMHCQLFDDNKMTYSGCLSQHWIPQDIRVKLEGEATAFTKVLAAKGVRGHLSFNAILLDDGRLLWTEINARKVSSSYPHQIVKRIGGKDAAKLPYISRRLRKKNWRTQSIKQFLAGLEPFLFSPRFKRGIIPYDLGRLNNQGEVYVLAVGENQKDAFSLFRHAAAIQ